MSTQSPQIVLAATTPQQHYNWIAAMSAALDALGVTRTTDTGQVDLTSITSIPLPTENTYGNAGSADSVPPVFEIRKLSASGMPDIFLRLDYGVYGNNNQSGSEVAFNYPDVLITIGKGTDGAGNITSIQQATTSISVGSRRSAANLYAGSSSLNSRYPSQNAQQCDFASDGQNYLTIMLGENAPIFENFSVLAFGVERTIDPGTGNYDAAGACGFCGHTGGNSYWFYSDFGNQLQWSGVSGMPSIAPPFNIGSSISTVDIFPFVGCTQVPKGAPTVALSYYASAVNAPVAFPATLYSTPHTYKACPRSMTSADPYNTGTKLALRFD